MCVYIHTYICIYICIYAKSLQLCMTLFDPMETVTHRVPLSIGFSMQVYWSGLPFPSPGHLLNPGIEPGTRTLKTDSLLSKPLGKLGILNHMRHFEGRNQPSTNCLGGRLCTQTICIQILESPFY